MISNRLLILYQLVPIDASTVAAALRSRRSGRGRRSPSTAAFVGGSGSSPAAGQGGGGGGSAPSTQNSGGFNLQDYPNLWNQLQHYHEGPAIDNQGNCIADCYGWTGSN